MDDSTNPTETDCCNAPLERRPGENFWRCEDCGTPVGDDGAPLSGASNEGDRQNGLSQDQLEALLSWDGDPGDLPEPLEDVRDAFPRVDKAFEIHARHPDATIPGVLAFAVVQLGGDIAGMANGLAEAERELARAESCLRESETERSDRRRRRRAERFDLVDGGEEE